MRPISTTPRPITGSMTSARPARTLSTSAGSVASPVRMVASRADADHDAVGRAGGVEVADPLMAAPRQFGIKEQWFTREDRKDHLARIESFRLGEEADHRFGRIEVRQEIGSASVRERGCHYV